jgi:hypothetical protein
MFEKLQRLRESLTGLSSQIWEGEVIVVVVVVVVVVIVGNTRDEGEVGVEGGEESISSSERRIREPKWVPAPENRADSIGG